MAFNVSIVFQAIDKFSNVSSKINRSISEQRQQMDKTSVAMDKLVKKTRNWGAEMKKTGAIMTAAVTLPAVLMAKKMVDAASDAGETQSKFNEIFRDMSTEANQAAKNFAKGFGVANSTAQDMISNTGDILTGIGMTQKESLKLSVSIAQLGSDLTSFKNFSGGAAQASQILTKALLGERESLASLGIKISEEEVKTKALALVQEGQRFSSVRQAKAQATLALIMERSKNAIGDTQRTWNSYANATRRVQEQQKQLSETFGRLLLPFAAKLNELLSKLLTTLEGLSPRTQKIIVSFGAFLAVLGPILLAVAALTALIPALVIAAKALAVVFAVAGAAMLVALSPIGLAITAIIAGVVLLKKNWIAVSDAIGGTIEQIQINFQQFLASNPLLAKAFDFAFGGESKVDINLNVNDQGGNVSDVSTQSAGAPGVDLNVGVNMAGS